MIKALPIDVIRPRKQVKARLNDVPDAYIDKCLNEGKILEPSFCRVSTIRSDQLELMSDPRPWLAAQICQYDSIPGYVLSSDFNDYQPFSGGVSMNPMDVAELNQKLLLEQNLTVTALAQRLGVDRTALAHSLRLLKLADSIKEKVRSGTVSAGFARRFASFKQTTQISLFEQYTRRSNTMSIRELENELRRHRAGEPLAQTNVTAKDPSISRLEQRMSENLGSQVEIHSEHLTINFGGNLDVFDGILQKLGMQSSSF